MMRRFRILGLVLAVLLLLVPCFVLAEDTLEITIPETLKAGEDLVISWTPQTEDQMLNINVNGDNGYTAGYYNVRKTPLVFKGLQAGTYTVNYTAAGDGYEENWQSATLTVSENSAQPAAPTLTLDGGKAYSGLSVMVLLDQEYEDIACRAVGPYGNMTEDPTFFGDRFTLWPHYYEERITIYASVKKNGVWSKEAVLPITFDGTKPAVSGLTVPNWRDTVVLGETIHIYVVLPRDEGSVSIESFMGDNEASIIGTSNMTTSNGISSLLIPGTAVMNNLVPGEYSVVFTWTKADGSKETVTKALTITGEKLVSPTIDAPPLDLKAGESFILTGQCNDADRVDLTISCNHGDGDYYYAERGAEILEDGTWRCEMPVLGPGVYEVEASGYSGRLSTSSSQRGVVISGADSYPAPTLTRLTGPGNGAINAISLSPAADVDLTGKQVTWRIVEEPEYGLGYTDSIESESADGGIGRYYVYSEYAQTYTITAVYEADGIQSLPEQIVFETTGEPYPVNGPTPIELSVPETVKAGENLRITLTSSVPELRPYFSLTEKETGFSVSCTSEWSTDRKTLIYTANGYDLEPGEYSIRVTASADTYEPVRKRYSLTVEENPDRPAAAFTVSPEEPINIEPVIFTAGTDYDKIAVRTRSAGEENYGYRYVYDHTDSVSVNLRTAGEWEAELMACDGQVWTLPQTVQFTVAQAPMLEAPVFDSSMTATLEVGQPLQIKVNEIDPRATYLVCDVLPEMWYEPAYHEEVSNLGSSYQATVPDELLQWSGNYTVVVTVFADGYEEAYNSFDFTLTGERPAAPSLTFSTTSGKTGDVIEATVTAEGATEAELVKSYSWGNGGDDMKSLGVYKMKNGTVTIPVNLNFNESQDFMARAKVDGVWSVWSERTLIQASERPENLPEVVPLAVWPETLTAGQTVDLELLPAEGISFYRIMVVTNQNSYYSFTTGEAGLFTIPGYAIGKGEVTFYVSAGMEHSMSVASESRVYEDVKAADLDPLTIALSPDEVAYGADYTVSLVGVQADAVMVLSRGQNDYVWEQAGFRRAAKGEKLTEVTLSATDLTGTEKIRAAASVGGKWTDWSNIETIRVGKNQGVLPNPVPTAAMADGNLHVSWSAVDGATGYDCVWYNVAKNVSRSRSVSGTELDIPEADLENGEYIIYVYSKAPGYGRNESCSRVIVTATGSGGGGDTLPALRIELTSDTVMRGDFLEITVTNLDDYKPYLWFGEYPITAYVEERYGESYPCNYWGKIRIPTQELDPQYVEDGRFTVTVTAHSPGYEDVYLSHSFTVTEPDTEEMVFRISAEEAVTGEDYILSVNAPGASRIEIWDFWRCICTTYSDRCQITHGYGFTGEYPYYAKAYYYDEETGTETQRVSDTLTVKVSAPGGDIQDPGVHVQSVIAIGEDLVFTVDKTDGFATWDLNLRSEFNNESGYHDYYNQYTYQDHNKNRVVVPADAFVDYEENEAGESVPVYNFFKPGNVYNAELDFFQYGKNGYSFDVPIMIVEEHTETEDISLTVNGQKGTVEMAAHDPVTVKVQGPEDATALMVFAGHEWRFYRGNEVTIDWGWWTMNHIPEYLFFAKYTTEPLPETEFNWKYDLDWGDTTSNIVRMVNRTQGYLPEPEIKLNKEELTRGEWLTATITNMDDYAGYQNVSFYAAPYYEPTNQGFGHLYDWDGNDTIRIPTADLNPENRPDPFVLSVTVNASGGWYEGNAKVPFTVVEPSEQIRAFDISPKAVDTGESFTLSLYAPGAEEYRILENGNEVRTGNGGSLTEHRSGPRPENRTYQAYVRYPGDEEWTLAGTADVKITATHGAMPALQLSAPATLNAGENLIISFTGIDSVDGVDVQLKPLGEWNYIWHSWGAEKVHTIYAVQPEHTYHMERLHDPGETILEPGRIYEYRLDVSKRGYESVDLYGIVRILEKDASSAPDFMLKVNGKTDGADVAVRLGETVDVTVNDVPDSVTAVRLKNRYGWQENVRRQDGSFEGWQMGLNQSGTHPFFAQATTDQSVAEWAEAHNGNMYGFDWSTVKWTLTSNVVTVNAICYGTLEDPAVEFPKGTEVQRGSALEFSVSPVDHSNQCEVKIRRKNQDGTLSDALIEMEIEYERATLVQIPTDALSEGDYVLCVTPQSDDGYQGNDKNYDFSVVQADGWRNEPSFKASSTQILTREYVTFSVYAPGAVEIRLCNGNFNNTWKQDRNECMVSRLMLNRVREYRVLAYARYSENGEWEQVGQDIAIDVTAPNGSVELADIDVPPVVESDGMLTATLSCDYKGTNGYSECWITDVNDQMLEMELADRTVADGISRETYRISADRLAEGYCIIEAYAFPGETGWELAGRQAMTLISDDASVGTLTVSKKTIDLFEDVTVRVQAPGATAIALCADGEWFFGAGDQLEESFTAWIGDTKYFFALYTTENIDPEGNEWRNTDWDGWTGRTNGAAVTVLPPRYELEEVAFELAEDAVSQGKDLVVTIKNINEGIENVSYGAHLVPVGEDFSAFPWYGQDEDGKIRVHTFGVEPGAYDLIVSANAIACAGKTGRARVQINARSGNLSTLNLPAGLKVISSEAFAGVAAEKIIVPAGVETIESGAFANCPNLIEIELPEGITSFARDAFAGTGPVAVYGAEDSYLAAYADNVDNLVMIPVEGAD